MNLSCLPAPVRDDLAHVSLMALSPSLTYRVTHWTELDAGERDVTAADVKHMARLADAGAVPKPVAV